MAPVAAEQGPASRPQAIVVFGNPENRRVQMFCEAAVRLHLPAPQVIAYRDALSAGLDAVREAPAQSLVRIESPGEDEPVERALIALGAEHTPCAERPADYVPGQIVEHGRICCPQLWYRGFCVLLEAWEERMNRRQAAWMNHPADIRLAFDKSACQSLLERHGIPVPQRLGKVSGYEELRARMKESGRSRVFLKPAHGSSASGVVAMQASGSRVCAITSVELVCDGGQTRLYNSLPVRRYERECDVARLVDALAACDLHAEAWMPKATVDGSAFDLRVMVIGGEVRHRVVRTSRGPITNLHLGNRRGHLGELLRKVPGARLEEAWDTCRRVGAQFPRSLYLGIDLMFTPGFRRHAVLEVNAFGDLLPGVLDRGQDTFTAELACLAGFP